MLRDAQGHEVTGATREAIAHLDRAIRAFTLVYGDAIGHYDAARNGAPALVMAHLGKAWPLALSNDPKLNPAARTLLETARTHPMNERERAHAAALAHVVEGRRASAVTVLDRHLMRYPHDLVAHMAAMQMDGHLGRFPLARDRTARALARWSTQQPGWGIIQSFYSFGLEEAGDYAKAEDTARAAAELEPHGYWPHHCVSHVLEMTGRPQDGVAWMNDREAYWSAKDNLNRVHIWWHKALFHMELGDDVAALALYDGPIMETVRPLSQSLCNPAALLWRLDTLGCDVGDRWKKQASMWEGRADGRLAVFPDIHAAMAELGAGDDAGVERRIQAMRRTAARDDEAGRIYRDIGVPTVQGLAAFRRGDYSGAVDHLLPARFDLWKMGGSLAQRDIIDWTLTEAATRAGLREEALALAHERLASRPASVPNRRFLQRAEAIAA